MTATRALAVLALALATVAPSVPAAAQTSDFWREVTDPGWRRSRTFLRQGYRFLEGAADPIQGPSARRAMAARARIRFEKALALAPADPEALYAYAQATDLSTDPHDHEATLGVEEAVEAFLAVRRVDPRFREAEVANALGVLYTRLRQFEEAAQEYQVALDRWLGPNVIIIYSNMAEVVMLAGEPERALRLYERALELMREHRVSDARAYAQAMWGLAITRDRLGEHRGAIEAAGVAVDAAGLDMLTSDGIFFEPPEELYYYQALGHRALAEEEGLPRDERASALEESRRLFARFLADGGDDSRWAPLARRHVSDLAEEIAALRGAGRRGRRR